MEIEIEIEVDEYPPYDHSPFDPYQDTISVSEETYMKVMDYCKKGVFVLRDMNIPELLPIVEWWEEEVEDQALERFEVSYEEEFIEPKVTVKVDMYFFKNVVLEMRSAREYTPEKITSLNEGEIFVFGSNIHGIHGGGAARFAYEHFDAEWGVGEGLTGKCYALPTMEGGVDYIEGKVMAFIECAKEHPELKFYVTPVACGIAGFSEEEIAPLFRDAMELTNVVLPKSFVDILSE